MNKLNYCLYNLCIYTRDGMYNKRVLLYRFVINKMNPRLHIWFETSMCLQNLIFLGFFYKKLKSSKVLFILEIVVWCLELEYLVPYKCLLLNKTKLKQRFCPIFESFIWKHNLVWIKIHTRYFIILIYFCKRCVLCY